MNSAKSESIYWSTKLELMNSVKSESLASASALSIAATAPPQVSGTQIAVLNDVADGVANMVRPNLTCSDSREILTLSRRPSLLDQRPQWHLHRPLPSFAYTVACVSASIKQHFVAAREGLEGVLDLREILMLAASRRHFFVPRALDGFAILA